MHEVAQWVFLILGCCWLGGAAIAPWVHAYQLQRLTLRVEELELALQGSGGPDDDPGDEEPVVEMSNVVAFSRVA